MFKLNLSTTICLLLFVGITQINKGFSQFSYKVEGTVLNYGKPLSGADVWLENENGKVKQLLTGASGAFTFTLEPNREYTLFVTKAGFAKAKILYSTMVFSDEEEQKVKGISRPKVEIYELPTDVVAATKINEMLEKPYLSYYYSSEKSTLISDEIYDLALPQTMTKIQKISGDAGKQDAETKSLEEKYSKALAKADKFYEAKDYANASSAYNDALLIKQNEDYPQKKLLEIENIIATDLALKRKQQEEIEKAELEKLSKEKVLTDAAEVARLEKEKNEKEIAEKARLEKEKTKEEAKEVERIKNAEEENIVNEKYQVEISNADSTFGLKLFDEAKVYYSSALSIKPKELYPQDKLIEIENILEAKRKAEYTNELARKYPEGVTEEKSKEGNNMVTKRIVVKGNKGTLYIKKETNFGAVYYFKDVNPITEKQYNDETQVK